MHTPDTLENEFGISLPVGYKKVLIDYPQELEAEHVGVSFTEHDLIKSIERLLHINQRARASSDGTAYRMPDGGPWKSGFFIIGEDGCGGRFFIDTDSGGESVYYYDLPEHNITLRAPTIEKFYKEKLSWLEKDYEE